MERPAVLTAVVLAVALAVAAAAPADHQPANATRAGIQERIYHPALLKQPQLKWWQTGIVYQIYPASYKDSNGDGIGDLPGITSKLEYLQEIGVSALWLSPIYKSPNADMGYDISDFKDINPQYGTLDDFDKMVTKAHALGLKVVLDFVPNHSSDDHKWFKEAMKGEDNPYHDYYVWHKGKEDATGKIVPPTKWGSVFDEMKEGSAWQWVPSLNKYYYRTFHQRQPDLNYRNPAVVREMKNVFRFWARRGVDGFRIDAIPYLFEDRLMRDNPSGGNVYTENLPETYDMVRQWRQVFDEEGEYLGKDLVMMLEAYADVANTMKYYGTKDFPAGHFPFNFQFISNLHQGSTAQDYVNQINLWESEKPAYGWSNWVMGNHDNHRVGSRLGEGNIDGINMLVTLLPGTAVTYYGEEIGMTDNTALTINNCKDPQACPQGANEDYYKEHSRDYERTPMQWDDSANAGFSEGSSTWLPVAENYKEVNVEEEKKQANSHLKIYKKLAELREEQVVQFGTLKAEAVGNVVTFLRQTDTYSLLVLINLHNEPAPEPIKVNELYGYIGDLEVRVSSNFNAESIDLTALQLEGNAAVVLGGPRYKWWQTGIIYQIYPNSFKDSDGDGYGDIPGIQSKLEYLKEAGVTALWLSPIYPSGGIDQGYDITDFEGIDKRYGTMEQFEKMVEKAHELGLKVVLDFVPNHSSSQHEWFQKALDLKDPDHDKYYSYYVWRDAEKDDDGNPILPNDWQSVFGGSENVPAWTYVEDLDKFYLHQFHEKQPDLNYDNDEVVREMKNVLSFWMNRGVDGFRVDAIGHLFEHPEFLDGYENRVHQEKTFDMVQQWRELLDKEETAGAEKRDLVLMLEAWVDEGKEEIFRRYYGDVERPGAHFPFNFEFISRLPDISVDPDNHVKANKVANIINKWIKDMVPKHGWSNWVLGNHDKHRIGTRVGQDFIDAFNMLVTLLPGTTVTYYGEEIGMVDNRKLGWEDCKDPPACPGVYDTNPVPSDKEGHYKKETRDFERTPMQWNDDDNADFCGDECDPWLPVNDNKNDVNVESEIYRKKSHLFTYKRLANLRKEPAIQSGELKVEVVDDDVLCVSRKNESYAYLVLINFGEEDREVNIAIKHEDVGAVKEHVSYGFTASEVDLSAVQLPRHASVVLEGALRKVSTEPEDLKWWQTGIIYQIYPRSFQDSDGDGIGDLPGITSRLEYLRDLGVTAIWLSPIFASPDADMGYDISSFKDISELYGTSSDFDEMIQEAHRLGLKVMLDFVPNHTSDEHKWFEDIRINGKNSDYYDFYVWRKGTDDGPPNNWVSSFSKKIPGSAWKKFNEAENLYYLHQFHEKQPDLNYRNPMVVMAMKDVLSYWVKRGVDGFRVDAIQHLVEDEEFRDNSGDEDKDREMQMNQPLTYEILKQWRDLLDKEGALLQKDLTLMLEVYTDVVTLMKYFESELRPAGDFPFNFFTISELNAKPSADDVINVINKWISKKPSYGWSNWVVGNHDNHRVGSRLGEELIDAFNMLVTLLPGTAITYNGEEIGMLDGQLTVADCQDPQACADPEGVNDDIFYADNSRDFERTPFQWDDSDNAGFSSGKPWLPVSENYVTVNVKSEEKDPKSHLNVYKKLAALRKELAIQRGDFHIEKLGTNVLTFSRRNVSHAYVVAINFGETSETVDLSKATAYVDLPKMLKYVSSSNFPVDDDEEVKIDSLTLPEYASVVLTSEPVVDEEDYSDPIETTTAGASALSHLSLLLTAITTVCAFLSQ